LLFVFDHDCAIDPNFEVDLMPGEDKGSVLEPKQRSLQNANSLTSYFGAFPPSEKLSEIQKVKGKRVNDRDSREIRQRWNHLFHLPPLFERKRSRIARSSSDPIPRIMAIADR
jgi:hypothetical protein